MKLGFEFPNENRDLTADEWAKVDALHSQACKVRPYNLTTANLAGIRQRGLTVLLRPNSDGDIDVEGRVREISRAAWTLREHGIGDVWIIPDNEPNLHNKPVQPDYWQKMSRVIVGLYYGHYDTRALAATVQYLNPPLAVGQGEDDWYAAAGDLLGAADGQCIHAYGQLDTGLIGQTLVLAKQYAPGMPLIADEVGDSHPTTGWDIKTEALRVYLDMLKQSGVSLALLFHLGGTSDWSQFVPPLESVRRIGAWFAQEVPVAKQTTITPHSIPAGVQGGAVRFAFTAQGIDGTAKGFADVAYPIIPGSQFEERYGPNLTTEIGTFGDGDSEAVVNLPLATTPTPGPVQGEITLRIIELDGTTFDGGAHGPYPVVILPGSGSTPAPEIPIPAPVPAPATDAPYLHVAYHGLHEAELAAQEAGDTLLLHEVQQAIGVIDRRKAGDFR